MGPVFEPVPWGSQEILMPLSTHAMSSSLVVAYGVTSTALCLNLLTLWIASGVSRAKTGVAINSEDGARHRAPVSAEDPPAVARILRAHRNAEAVTYPFLLMGLTYVFLDGPIRQAVPIFSLFVIARVAHSIFYLAAKQPWRTISFAVSLLAAVALFLADCSLLIARIEA